MSVSEPISKFVNNVLLYAKKFRIYIFQNLSVSMQGHLRHLDIIYINLEILCTHKLLRMGNLEF